MQSGANVDRFSGYAAGYDAVRPQPPAAALDVLCEIIGTPLPALVVDLGSGTGLSTGLWIGRAQRIVGIEPNDDMRAEAVRVTPTGVVDYVSARADATGLPDRCADVVSCVQALHWMEPAATLSEVHRCLRGGGAFAALDCDWPPFVHWRLIAPWRHLHETAERIVANRVLAPGLRRWHKSDHVERMRTSGHFRAVTELCFHQRTSGNAERLIRLARSHGGLATALKAGDPEATAALSTFADEARAVLGDRVTPWTYTYRVRIGVK